MATCPKCGAEVPKTYPNKRKQIVGKCPGCGKMVTLGKVSEIEPGKAPERTPAKPSQKKPIAKSAGKTAAPSSRSARPPHIPIGQRAKPGSDGGFLSNLFAWLDTKL
jgi:endogenous inhibitor of DNA gyrase (YacG/DUF329 family)